MATVTACNRAGGSSAATVEGHHISTDRVLSLLKDRKVAAERQAQGGGAADLVGPGKDTFTKRAFADTLNQVVRAEILKRELARRHLEITSADRKSARFSLDQSAGAGTLAKLPEGLRNFVIEFDAAQAVLQKHLGKKAKSKTDQARAQYDQIEATSPEQLQQLCVTGAVFASKADAATAQLRLNRRATITAAVKGLQAQQVVDTEQCVAATQLPPEVQKLKVNGVTAPLANQGSFVVLRLARRKTLSFADVRAQLEKNLPEPGTAELQAEVGKLVAKAKVNVDPRFGRWNRRAGRVDPPAGTPPTTAPLTTPANGSPGGGSTGGGSTGGGSTPGAPPATQPGG